MTRVGDLRRQVRALAVAGLTLDELWRRTDGVLRRSVGWDVSAWGLVDPATLLSTGCLVLGAPFDADRERVVFELEHDASEVGRLIDLVHLSPPAVGLSLATSGRPATSPRYHRLLQPLGITDDLRVALVRDRTCWGSLYAYRRVQAFSADDVAVLGALAADLADGARLALLRADATSAQHPDSPGLLLLRPDGTLSATSDVAARWLALLPSDGAVPSAVAALTAALRASSGGPRRARVRALDGRWLVLHASHLDPAGSAVIVEAARPVEVAEVLCAAYGLSAREREVVGLVLRGEGNRGVARALGLSEHTVKEHLKAVFAKVGVLSRSELAARLLHEQYLPRRDAGVPASSQGFFRETA